MQTINVKSFRREMSLRSLKNAINDSLATSPFKVARNIAGGFTFLATVYVVMGILFIFSK
jgi:hypothetical protein